MLFLERGGGRLGCTVIVSKAISGLALGRGAQPKRLGLSFGFMVIDYD